MAKKAFLVNIAITTRIIADADASNSDIAREAIEKIMEGMIEDGIGSYLSADNVGEIEEDTECPFGTFENDLKEENS